MNLIVAREVPELGKVDIAKYTGIIDDWAKRIDTYNCAAEPYSKDEPS